MTLEQFMTQYLLEIALALIGGLLALAQYRSRTHHAREIARLQSEADGRKRDNDEQNNRHAREIQSLKSEADQQKAQLEIIKEYATGVPKIQETWQSVLNTMSARRLEGDKDIANALREIAQANKAHAQAVDDFGSILEIHTSAHGKLDKEIGDSLYIFVESAKLTHQAVDSQKEELQLVNTSIGTLTLRLDDLIDIDETHVLDEDTRHKEQKEELVAIKDALQTYNAILAKILKSTENSTQPIPQPTPETWHEDTEQTAPLPLNTRDDESDNPLLDSA